MAYLYTYSYRFICLGQITFISDDGMFRCEQKYLNGSDQVTFDTWMPVNGTLAESMASTRAVNSLRAQFGKEITSLIHIYELRKIKEEATTEETPLQQ